MLKKLFFPLVFLCTIGFTSELPAAVLTSVPDTNDGPVVVNVSMLLADINEIDGASQSFNANVFLRIEWQDDRLAHNGKDMQKRKLDDIWYPNVQFANETWLRRSLSRIVRVSPDGHVTFVQRVVGDFSQKLNLSEFPFDVQTFNILLVGIGPDKDKIKIKPLNDHAGRIADNFSLPDWTVIEHSFDAEMYKPSEITPGYPAVNFTFTVKRKIGYYWLHIIMPLIFIVMMSMMIFWIPVQQSAVQISISTTSMLTLIAYRFAISHAIPPLSYLTRLDNFILISTLLVFFSLVHSLITTKLAHRRKEKLAIKIDWINRFLFPIIFAYTIIYVLVLPRNAENEAEWSLLIPTLIKLFN